MEILYLGGFKQTVYFDTGRLQGYPLCEIDFFHFLIGSSIGDWSIGMWEVLPQKLVTPKNWLPQKIDLKKWLPPKKMLPQKIDQKKIGYPKKNVTPPQKKKLATPKMLAYFIARGFIIAFWKNGVLYCVRVY